MGWAPLLVVLFRLFQPAPLSPSYPLPTEARGLVEAAYGQSAT